MADEQVTPDTIAEAATGAQSFTSDGQQAVQIPIKDQIEAAKFANANKTRQKKSPLMGARYVGVIVG